LGPDEHRYLNPVPIREIHNRWMPKYAQPFSQALIGLKHELEHTA